jgi:polyisoprenoid-binding protein YceI
MKKVTGMTPFAFREEMLSVIPLKLQHFYRTLLTFPLFTAVSLHHQPKHKTINNNQIFKTMTTMTKWVLDPAHSEILFKVKHMMITNVRGEFRKFNAEASIAGLTLEGSSVKAEIDASSIFTNANDRDTHLKSADFFDAENHRQLVFTGTSYTKTDEDKYTLKGNLTIKGVTKEVAFDVEFGGINKDPWGNEKAGFSLNGTINRKDWGLNWNAALEAGGVLVGEEVKISAEVQLLKQA